MVGPVDGADLSGRRRIFRHPPVQGDARASSGSISTSTAIRRAPRWCSAGASSTPPRRRSRRRTAQVNAAEIALNGVREEARVGQRTTLDVLNAQQELVNARVALVTAQHDRVVASYTLLAAVGALSMQRLGLNVADLRSDGALPAGARRLGRRAHSRRPITVPERRGGSPQAWLPSTFAMTYSRQRCIVALRDSRSADAAGVQMLIGCGRGAAFGDDTGLKRGMRA